MDIPFDDLENIEDPAIREILGQYKKAVDAGDSVKQGESLLHLGTLYAIREQFPTAIKYYKQALSIQKRVGDTQGQSKSLSNIGLAHADLGHYIKAIKYHLRALEISRKNQNEVAESNHIINLAETYEQLEQYDKAIQCLQDVQLIYQKMDVPHLLRKARLNLERLQKLQQERHPSNTIVNKRRTAPLPNIPSDLQLETSTTEFPQVQTKDLHKLPNEALKAVQDTAHTDDISEAEPTTIIPNIDEEVLFDDGEEGEFGVDTEPAEEPVSEEHIEETGKIPEIDFDSDEEIDDDKMNDPEISTHTRLNFIRQAIKDMQYQLSIAEAIGDMGKKGDYLMRLATLYMKLKQYDNAINHYEQAIVLFGVLGKSYFREEAERGILEAREQKWSS